jgi:hypothetical protein
VTSPPPVLAPRVAGERAYGYFGGQEIFNSCRTAAYLSNGIRPAGGHISACGCPNTEFWQIVGDEAAYQTPMDDPAPWYDDAFPESGGFTGFLVLEVTGLDVAPFERQLTQKGSHGAIIGRGRLRHREVLIRGVLLGMNCSAVQYGFNWLKDALRESGCTGFCQGDAYTWMGCIPCDPEETSATAEFRTLYDTALLSGPTIVRKIPLGAKCSSSCSTDGGCFIYEVEFILAAGNPFAHHPPDELAVETELEDCEAGGCSNIEWSFCEAEPECGDLPCFPVEAIPSRPQPINGCAPCEPFEVSKACVAIPPQPGSWSSVPIFTVTAGPTPLKNVIVRFYTNPSGLDPLTFPVSTATGGFAIASIPAGGTVTVDGTTQTVTLLCEDNTQTDGFKLMSGLGGGFVWPELNCQTVEHAACITVDCTTVSEGAVFSLSVVGRDR